MYHMTYYCENESTYSLWWCLLLQSICHNARVCHGIQLCHVHFHVEYMAE